MILPEGVREGDVYIEHGKIKAIDWSLNQEISDDITNAVEQYNK